jgi:DnaK suppressor protein
MNDTSTPALMTEAEIMAAPEDDYMSPRQLTFFRQRLQEEQDQLLNNAQETTTHLQDNEATPDPSDRASVEEEHTLELRVRDRERKLLKKVEEAIARIDTGEYGWCEETGEPIGIARLIARPTATLSIEAQERREKLKKMHGG